MKITKILFLTTIILILLTLIITEKNQIKYIGTIKNIKHSDNLITINIENSEHEYILFENKALNLKKGDTIKIIGKESIYNNKKQITIKKIILLTK